VSGQYGVIVRGGTLIMTGGSVSASILPIDVELGGTATISGGFVSGGTACIEVGGADNSGGSALITGGALSGLQGLQVYSGTMTISAAAWR